MKKKTNKKNKEKKKNIGENQHSDQLFIFKNNENIWHAEKQVFEGLHN